MAPEPAPANNSSPEQLAARQDRLEQQVASLTARLHVLEHNLPTPVPASEPPPAPPVPPVPSIPPASPIPLAPAPPKVSLENRLGSQVFNRVGIIALLIGATWFLKLAVDNRWIGPTGRILIGLLAGAGLILWSERFRRSGYPAFSYSLKALGSGVLYLSLWAAFQLYHLLPAAAALAAMLLVTAWNAFMAWSQNAELLAAYALAGGLATPLLLSTGGDHEIFLFTYLLALDLASAALARLRTWPRLLPVALLSTIAYFIGWYSSFYQPPALVTTSLFVVLLSASFIATPFARSSHQRPGFYINLEDIALPLAAAAFLSLALFAALKDAHHRDLLPWLMLALSAVYLALLRLPQSHLARAIHLAIAVVFLTVAIPLKASGAWITIAWLVEGTALLWASTRAFPPVEPASQVAAEAVAPGKLTLLTLASAALLLGIGGTFFQLSFHRIFGAAPQPFLNQGFATALTALVAFALSAWIGYRASSADPAPAYARIAAALTIAFNLTAIFAVVAQINLLFPDTIRNADVALQRALAVSAFLMLYGAVLLAAGFWRRSALIRWQALILLVVAILKTFLYDMRNLSQGYRVLSFVGLGALLMAISFAYQKDWLALREPHLTPPPTPAKDLPA